jgi:hypothetical protein
LRRSSTKEKGKENFSFVPLLYIFWISRSKLSFVSWELIIISYISLEKVYVNSIVKGKKLIWKRQSNNAPYALTDV